MGYISEDDLELFTDTKITKCETVVVTITILCMSIIILLPFY
jgi:hypothetical protein